MNFTNLSNTFSIFGNFAVFDDDNMNIIHKIFSDCNIALNQENNQANHSGKVMIITDNKKHNTIFLRPNRLDVQVAGSIKENKAIILNMVNDIYKAFSQLFKESLGTRIAYVTNFFVFDDDEEKIKTIGKQINLISGDIKELTLRTNQITNVLNEDTNLVFSINNIRIADNRDPNNKRKALMLTFDINTLGQNNDERFDLHELNDYYDAFFDLAYQKIEELNYL